MKYAVVDADALSSTIDIDEVLRRSAEFPSEIERRLLGLSYEELRTRRSNEVGEFSLHEHVWHLRDIEIGGYARRIRAIVMCDRPFLPDIDGTQLAVVRDYGARPLAVGLRELARARARNVAFLRALSLDDFARRGELEDVGCVTLARVVRNWSAHDDGHIREIDALRRALGR